MPGGLGAGSPGRPAGHPGRLDHARRSGTVSKNPGLTRDATRQREYGRLLPGLPQVRLIADPLRGHPAAWLLPSWAAGFRVPAP